MQRQIGHFIKEQGSSAGGLEQSCLVAGSAGKTAFYMTEEFTFHQRFRNRTAVNRNKRLF